MPAALTSRRSSRLTRATHSLIVLSAACGSWICSHHTLARPAFLCPSHWKPSTLSHIRRRFFEFEERGSSPKYVNTKREFFGIDLQAAQKKKKTKTYLDPEISFVNFLNCSLGMQISETNVVYTTERSNTLYECALKLCLGDEEEPMVFKGAAFTREQAEENAALMARYRLQNYSVEKAARNRADRIKQLSMRVTEAFGKLDNGSDVADLEIGKSFKDAAFVLRALAEVRGLAFAQLVVSEDSLVKTIRMSRSSDAAFVDKTAPTFRAVACKGASWANLKVKTREQLLTDGKGAVKLLLPGGKSGKLHRSVIVLIRNLQHEFMQESSEARLNFLPSRLSTEDADAVSVAMWIA